MWKERVGLERMAWEKIDLFLASRGVEMEVVVVAGMWEICGIDVELVMMM